jgi:hypothetical protein
MYSAYVSNYDRAMETLIHLIEVCPSLPPWILDFGFWILNFGESSRKEAGRRTDRPTNRD